MSLSELAGLPSGTVTFLFTDVEGSTRLLALLGGDYGEVQAAHQSILRAAFAAFDGHEIDTQGDSFFVAFRRAKEAVAAAIAAQRELASHEWPEGAVLRVRIGIHTGEPVVGPSTYVGLAVPRAARVMAAGHGGQILLTNTTRELVEDDLRDDVSLRDLGEHWLKDLDRPERIFQVVAADLVAEHPPLRTEDAPTPYTGLEEKLAAAAEAVVATPRVFGRLRVAGAVCAFVAAVGVAAVVLTRGSSGSDVRVEADTAVALNAATGRVMKAVTVGSGPVRAAVGAGSLWVANGNANSVSRIDPATKTVLQTINLDCSPAGIAVGGGSAWVTCPSDGSLVRISADTDLPVHTTSGLAAPTGVAVGEGSVWVATVDDHSVTRFDSASGARVKTIATGGTPSAIAVGKGAVWVSDEASSSVLRIDPKTNAVSGSVGVGKAPQAIAVGLGSVWVANTLDGTVTRIDPTAGRAVGLLQVGEGPRDLAVAHGKLWVANEFSGTVSRIDPADERKSSSTVVGSRPTALAVVGGLVWATVRAAGGTHRGGTFAVGYKSSPLDWLDPARAYNTVAWQILSLTGDGLVAFRRVGGSDGRRTVPDLATDIGAPTASGRTYTFRVRRGIRYSTGALVKPADIRFALERVFESGSPGSGYYRGIVGAADCHAGARCDLSSGVTINGQTIVFHLVEADPEFPQRLALPFAQAVPTSSPRKPSKIRPVPGTGPYAIVHYDRKRQLMLKRNPHFRSWSGAARPDGYPDSIVLKFGISGDAATTAVEHGALDYAPEMPEHRFDEVSTRYASQVERNAISETSYLILNTRVPPFNSLAARRAVNFALDRNEIIRRSGLPQFSQPACQMLPPNVPGYKRYCPYTLRPANGGTWNAPDVAKARRLIAESHTHGMRVTLITYGNDDKGVGRYLVGLFNRLGYRATSRKIPEAEFGTAPFFGGPRATMNVVAGEWFADYPSARSFLEPQFACRGSANDSGFCDVTIDAEMRRATALQSTDPRSADARWSRVDWALADQAATVPYSNQKSVDFVSKRVGNFEFHPQYGILLDQLWLTGTGGSPRPR